MKRLAAALASLAASLAFAAAPVKVGMIAPFSGGAADFGRQMKAGIDAFFKLHGDTFAGRKIEVIVRDTGGPNPEVAKRLAQELVTRDK
ncbi:MAG TPA: ABC transporter substrate-binding protein, partial [Usitatibacter sp.]